MKEFFENFLALTRPLSNIKNVIIVLIAFYFSGEKFNFGNLVVIILGVIALSFVYSAVYSYNSFNDFHLDERNKNKSHYSKAILYFGKEKSIVIILILLFLGLFLGLFLNFYFFLGLVSLLLIAFFYSSNFTRFKEKIVLDVLFGSTFTYFFRFVSAWFLFSFSFPPILPILILVFAKTGGYMIYKEFDRQYLTKLNIKNSITVVSKKTNIALSNFFLILSVFFSVFLCLNSKFFYFSNLESAPIQLLFLLPFVFLPILVADLKALEKIKTDNRLLRNLGSVYTLILIIITLKLIY